MAVHVPAIAVYERYHGLEYLDNRGAEREGVNRVFDRYPIVDPGRPAMQTAARIDATLDASGQALDDVIVGTTAAIQGEPVLSRNADHSERMTDVDVARY